MVVWWVTVVEVGDVEKEMESPQKRCRFWVSFLLKRKRTSIFEQDHKAWM